MDAPQPTPRPMTERELDAEMHALLAARSALVPLSFEARARVLDWLRSWTAAECPSRAASLDF